MAMGRHLVQDKLEQAIITMGGPMKSTLIILLQVRDSIIV